MEKNGVTINWVDGAMDPLAEARGVVQHHHAKMADPAQGPSLTKHD